MRFIIYAAFILFTSLCVVIAVSNGTVVLFSLEPIPFNVEMPAYGLVFLGIFIGLCGGWIVAILSGIKNARRHRTADKKIRELEQKLKSQESKNIELSNTDNNGKSSSN